MLASGKRARGGFMHRSGSVFFPLVAITLVAVLTGCLGKSSSNSGNEGVSSVSLNPPSPVSLEVGGTRVFTASGKNAGGGTVLGVNIQYSVQSGNPNQPAPLSVASNGNACAGTWDANVAICTPGNPGIAIVTAVINGVSSVPTTVYVHNHVANIQIAVPQDQPPHPYDCFSQGQTYQYEAYAYDSNNVDISNTVGPMTWSSSNTSVVSTTPMVTGSSGNQVNMVEVTARAPGITQLFASVSGTYSNPYPFTTCLIQAIYLQIGGQSQGGNSITVNNGGGVPVRAIAIDTLYNRADFGPLSAPPLTWSTTNPEVAAFSSATNTTSMNTASAHTNLGGATLTASCTPPSCNIGIFPSLPIYASDCNASTSSPPCPLPGGTKAYSAISVDVVPTTGSNAKPNVYTAYAATTGCQNAAGCSSSLFSVSPGTTPGANIFSLSRTPNSIMFNNVSSGRLYLGSDQGLMYVAVSGSSPAVSLVSNSPTPCNISLCGKVLTISNDGTLVVVSDTVSTPNQVYIYNGGSSTGAPIDLIIPGETATAAAFSPDQLKLFILTNAGNMYVYSTVDALTSVPIASTAATDVKFSADGSFAYVAGTPNPNSISGYATCDTPDTQILSGITTTYPTLPPVSTNPPFALYPLPMQQLDSAGNWTQAVLVLDPPNVDTFGVNVTQLGLPDGQFVCNPPTVTLDPNFPRTSFSLGQSNTPLYAQLAADGNEFIIVEQNVPAVLVFNVANGTTTSVPLANSAAPLAASGSTDGSQIFVAACDQYDQSTTPPTCAAGSVHIVNTTGQGDLQQVPYVNVNNNNDHNMCSNGGNPTPQCFPNLIAVKPD